MGLASLLLGENNPFAQWANQNSNYLGAIGGGLMKGQNLQHGLELGGAKVGEARELDLAAAEKAKADQLAETQANATQNWLAQHHPDLADAVGAGMPVSQAWSEAMRRNQSQTGEQPNSIQEYEYAKQNGFGGSFQDWMQTGRNGAAGPQLGLAPQWAWDEKTKQYVLGQMSTDGRFQRTEMDGLQPVTPYDLSAQRSGGTAFGKNVGGAQFDLPSAELTMNQTLEALNAIRAEKKGMAEQFGNIAGVPQQLTPAWPGSDKAKFQVAVDRGVNLAFLQAREMLRGGGQITDFESRKAETAITNMQSAMEKGDQRQFEEALATFEQAVVAGFQKLQSQAGMMPGFGGSGPSPQMPTDNTTSTGVQWSIDP